MDKRIEKSIAVLNHIMKDLGIQNLNQLSEKLQFNRPERLYKIMRGDVSISRNLAERINEVFPKYSKDEILTGDILVNSEVLLTKPSEKELTTSELIDIIVVLYYKEDELKKYKLYTRWKENIEHKAIARFMDEQKEKLGKQ